jgi:hypothetical protein
MSTIPSIPSWSDKDVLTHTALNTMVSSIRDTVNTYGMFTDVARTVTAVQTFSAAPVFSTGFGVAGTITVSTGGIAVTGNSTIVGTLGSVTTLTCITVTATNLGGTVTTAAQASITSLGTLTALAVAGAVTVTTAKATFAATAAGYASARLPHGTAPSSPVDGDVWTTTAGLYARINAGTVGPLGVALTQLTDDGTTLTLASRYFTASAQAACALTDAGQTINTTTAVLAFTGAESFDVGGLHEGVTNPSRITIPTGAGGVYTVSFYGNAYVNTGTANFYFTVDGVQKPGAASLVTIPFTSSSPVSFGAALSVSAGSYIEVVVQSSAICTVLEMVLSAVKVA